MPQVDRSTKTGMAPPAQGQRAKAPMKRMDKTVPVGAVLPPMPGQAPRPPLPPSARRVEVAQPQPPPPPEHPQEGDEATRVGVVPNGIDARLPEDEPEEVTRVGAPAADVLRGLADAQVPGGPGAGTMEPSVIRQSKSRARGRSSDTARRSWQPTARLSASAGATVQRPPQQPRTLDEQSAGVWPCLLRPS